MASKTKVLNKEDQEEFIAILKARFEDNLDRHPGIKWAQVAERLSSDSGKLWSLSEMEKTGGEPDVVGFDKDSDEFIFYDCSPESPDGRRSTCYDLAGLESRKSNKPDHNAVDMANDMGVDMLTEEEYRTLQQLGNFDMKTSSWLKTPESIRKRGGAIFGDFRYDHIFIYHNGAQSYYAARGFRASLRV